MTDPGHCDCLQVDDGFGNTTGAGQLTGLGRCDGLQTSDGSQNGTGNGRLMRPV